LCKLSGDIVVIVYCNFMFQLMIDRTKIAIAFVIMVGTGISLLSCKKSSDQNGRMNRQRVPVVDVLVVKPQPADALADVVGTLLPAEEVELRPEVPGKIIELNFSEGSLVHKGQLLVRLKDDDLEAQIRKTKLQLDIAEKDEFRKRKLLEIQGISQEEYDAALNLVNTLRADRDLLKARLDQMRIYAPFDGKIGLRSVSPGAYVSTSTVIATLQQTNPMKLEFSVPERLAYGVVSGKTVSFTIGDSETVYSGKIYATEPGIDPSTRSLKARALVTNPEGKLMTGSFARINLLLEHFPEAFVIPAQALVPKLNGQMVYLVKNGLCKSSDVNVTMRTDSSVVVTSGLKTGDSVIISGLLQVRVNAPVNVMPSGKTN